MLIRTPQPPGKIYTQLTQAPVDSYADFLNWFRQGQTVDENTHLPNPQTIQPCSGQLSPAGISEKQRV